MGLWCFILCCEFKADCYALEKFYLLGLPVNLVRKGHRKEMNHVGISHVIWKHILRWDNVTRPLSNLCFEFKITIRDGSSWTATWLNSVSWLWTKATSSMIQQTIKCFHSSVLQNRFVLMAVLGFLWKVDKTPANGPVILSAGCQAFRISWVWTAGWATAGLDGPRVGQLGGFSPWRTGEVELLA